MSLLAALSTLPYPYYHHPIPSLTPPPASSKLNPYLPLPTHSALFTTPTFLPSLPPPAAGSGSVIHVLSAAPSTTPPSNGTLVLLSRVSQEAYDHALLALRLAREGTVVYHLVSEEALGGDIDELGDVAGWLESSSVNGLSDTDGEKEDDKDTTIVHAYEAASLSLLKATRRAQRPFTHHSSGSSSRLIISFLPTPIDVGNVLDMSLASPLPRDKLRHAAKGAESIVVIEGGSGKFGQAWARVVDALEGEDYFIRSVLVASADLSGLLVALDGNETITRIGDSSLTEEIPSNSITVPTTESMYTTLLSSSLSPLEVLNDPSSLSANESTSPLYAFGKAVALRAARNRLIELAKSTLRAPNTRQDLHQALAVWLLDETEEAGKKVEEAVSIGEGSTAEEAEILSLGQAGHWAKKNLWIVISNSWAQDLASSGLHHALSSGLDINLLVYETSPSPFSPLAQKDAPRERKKDLALYALNMGDVYVSSVAVFADYAGVINAMREAESYRGPGLLLAYLPWGEKEDGEGVGFGEKAGPLERLRETKWAVSGGWWPMFRWNPSLADEKRFTLDSPHIKKALSEFVDRQSHLSQLTRATPSLSPSITNSAGTDLVSARKEKARKAYDALVNSLGGPGMLVLYASDAGNAEKVAKRLVTRAKMRGVAASFKVLDEIAGQIRETLGKEKNVVLVTSTAGQGESPQNGREFTKALNKLSAAEPEQDQPLSETKFTVFGMGDSNYWPRKEDYIYYNKTAKDLHPKLAHLGMTELCPLGLGDDSDPDGWQTGYKPWESALWRGLGVDSVEVSEEAQEETVANEHIKIASDYLRGTILEGLEDQTTGAIGASDAQLTKFHGTYLQVSEEFSVIIPAFPSLSFFGGLSCWEL